RAETLIFLDADQVPDRNWLLAFEQALDGGAADVSWGQVCPPVDDVGRPRRRRDHPCVSDAANGKRAVCVGVQTLRRLSLELSDLPADEVGTRLSSLALLTGSWAVRREVLERTQGLVPALSSLADWELGIQLVEVGARFGRAERGRTTRGEAAECWLSGATD